MRDVVYPPSGRANYDAYGYAAGVKSGGFLFVSGQVGIDETGAAIKDAASQFEAAFDNLGEVLSAAGCGCDDVVDVTTYHVNMYEHFDVFAAAKLRVFAEAPFPTWTAIGVVTLADPDLLLEIKATARLR